MKKRAARKPAQQARQKTSGSPPKIHKRRLTKKQTKFLKGKVSGESSRKAALDAGYAPSVADKANSIIGGSPTVREAFEELLKAAGVTENKLAMRIAEGLDATIVGRETAHAKREVLVDFAERREMLELILKLKDLLTCKHEIDVGPTLEELLTASYAYDRAPEHLQAAHQKTQDALYDWLQSHPEEKA